MNVHKKPGFWMMIGTIVIMVLLVTAFNSKAQAQDCEKIVAIGASYIPVKTVAVEGTTILNKFTATIGVGYTPPKTYDVVVGRNVYQEETNSLTLYAYVGYRVLQIPYKMSIFLNGGYAMGNMNGANPIGSVRFLFPNNKNVEHPKAFGIEPFFILGEDIGVKLSYYIRI